MKRYFKYLFVFILFSLLTIPVFANREYGWGFKRNTNYLQPDVGFYKDEISGTNSYYVGSSRKKNIYLTFDSGYDNKVLGPILDVLKEKNIQCTFFVTGDFIVREEELLRRLVAEGHLVGNHTWTHRNITRLSDAELKEELEKTEREFYKRTNTHMVKFFRPPSGVFNRSSLLKVSNLGYTTFFWSLAYKDWETNNQRGGDFAYRSVMSNIHNGAIVLLHTVSQDNLEALPRIIDDLIKDGYRIKNLDHLVPVF